MSGHPSRERIEAALRKLDIDWAAFGKQHEPKTIGRAELAERLAAELIG